MTITEFLEARIAEDEAALETVPVAAQQSDDFDFGGTDDYLRFTMGYGRAVAECEAKREILEECRDILSAASWEYSDAPDLADTVLRNLASVYKDHPDYPQEWAG